MYEARRKFTIHNLSQLFGGFESFLVANCTIPVGLLSINFS